MNYPLQNSIKKRVIISSDAACEVDDLFAIAHALLSPTLAVKGLAAAHFADDQSMEKSKQEILKLLDNMDSRYRVPVFPGSPEPLKSENQPIPSEASDFIIKEAHTEGPPLYITIQGAATDIASAYLLDPSISKKIEAVIWLGGSSYPEGGPEFNLQNDVAAANVLMDSDLPLWQIPLDASGVMKLSYAETLIKVAPYGLLGNYLKERYEYVLKITETAPVEIWTMWDMAATGLLLDEQVFSFVVRNAPRFSKNMCYEKAERHHPIRVYKPLLSRFVMEDFLCKLRLQ